jgi:hypothetical protein
MNEEFPRKEFDFKALKRWKLVQVVAVLPLALTVVLMIYFREAAEFHIVAFFLILIVGVLMPQISGDMIQSHVVLKGELSKEVRFLPPIFGFVAGRREQVTIVEPFLPQDELSH